MDWVGLPPSGGLKMSESSLKKAASMSAVKALENAGDSYHFAGWETSKLTGYKPLL
jgi:hypothetical protein